MAYWKITLLDPAIWNGSQWTYNGIASTSRTVEFGDSPVRDRNSRNKFIAELSEANANFTVEKINLT